MPARLSVCPSRLEGGGGGRRKGGQEGGRPVDRPLFFLGGVKLVKFWDLLWLRVDYLAIALDLAIFFLGGGGGVKVKQPRQ